MHSPNRLLEEEAAKRAELECLHLQQKQALCQTQAKKQELEIERLDKERELQAAVVQLERVETERHGALQKYEVRENAGGLNERKKSSATSLPYPELTEIVATLFISTSLVPC